MIISSTHRQAPLLKRYIIAIKRFPLGRIASQLNVTHTQQDQTERRAETPRQESFETGTHIHIVKPVQHENLVQITWIFQIEPCNLRPQ